MDNHGKMVADARAKAVGAPAKLYFAYSTILDPQAFGEWSAAHGYQAFHLPTGEIAEAIDADLVFDFPSRFWGGRVAGIADVAGKRIWGKLFSIAGQDWPIIQHKEGAVTGMCVERAVRCKLSDGKMVDAIAFTTAPQRRSSDGPVSDRFVAALTAGARAAQLPADYVASLSRY